MSFETPTTECFKTSNLSIVLHNQDGTRLFSACELMKLQRSAPVMHEQGPRALTDPHHDIRRPC